MGKLHFSVLKKILKRLNNSLARLEMPQVDEAELLEGLKQLVDIERDWIPEGEGQSLYIRPFVFATEGALRRWCITSV